MNFIFTGKNIEVTEAIKEKVEKKLSKFEKFFNEHTEVHATFRTEKNKHIVDVTISCNGVTYRAEECNDDMYTSIDKIVDIIEGQIRKNKTKIEKMYKGSDAKNVVPSMKAEGGLKEKKITKFKKYSVKPMTIDEAIMQMNLEKEEFFVFENSTTKHVNMLYKLEDGNYGLVEPEE